ncbi:MAG: hypothetical protein ACI83W_001338 [Marinoscillum sp.]|jgi:hypothetical protein
MSTTNQQLIDNYLRNELSTSEAAQFESDLSSNPELLEQLQMDKLIVEGISDLRKAQLKSRLDAIQVAPLGFGLGQFGSVSALQGVAVIATLSIASISAWYFLGIKELDSNPNLVSNSINIDFPKVSIPIDIITFPLVEVKAANSDNDKVLVPTNPIKIEKVVTEEMVAANDKVEKSFIPKVDLPNLQELDDEAGLTISDAELPQMAPTDEISRSENVTVQIEASFKKSESIKYKYYDGKLYLYGDFKDVPYEILEINAKQGRKLYMYYGDRYYNLMLSDKAENLVPITNQTTITELDIVRNNKY